MEMSLRVSVNLPRHQSINRGVPSNNHTNRRSGEGHLITYPQARFNSSRVSDQRVVEDIKFVVEFKQLGREVAVKAKHEWGQPNSKITHLISPTSPRRDLPAADSHITTLLGHHLSVKYYMYQQGRFVNEDVLQLFREFAHINRRLLVVCSEITPVTIRATSEGPSRDVLKVRLRETSAEVKNLRSENERLREKELQVRIRAAEAEHKLQRREENKRDENARVLVTFRAPGPRRRSLHA